MFTLDEYKEASNVLSEKLGSFKPEILIILGSGLGSLADYAENPVFIDYSEIPHMCKSTALGHKGRFAAGKVGGKNVLMMQGRLHIYEGWTPEQVVFPIRLAKIIGIDKMIVTNAAGGINESFSVGDLMLISDYLKFNYPNPLIGPNFDEFGPRFPDMTQVFDREYMELFRKIAENDGEKLQEGVYFYTTGPQFETPAEIRAMRLLGADAVGMSTVPECIAARHLGMHILGITLITNMAAGITGKPLNGIDVVEIGNAAGRRLINYVTKFLENLKG